MNLDSDGFAIVRFLDKNGNEIQIYKSLFVRLRTNGNLSYDQEQRIPVKKRIVYSFPGKDGKIVESIFEVPEGTNDYPLRSLVIGLNANMRLKGGNFELEAIEITHDDNVTRVSAHCARAHAGGLETIVMQTHFGTMTFNNFF